MKIPFGKLLDDVGPVLAGLDHAGDVQVFDVAWKSNRRLPKGSDVRALVLKAMRVALKAGRITHRQYRNARKIRFPDGVPRILGDSLKVRKSRKLGYLTAIVYLAPELESIVYGGMNACFFASPGCAIACLGRHAGHLRSSSSYNARAWKTLLWLFYPEAFKSLLLREVYNLRNLAIHQGLVPSVRMNGASDVAWERKFRVMFDTFPDVVFYDYSKVAARVLSPKLPPNYHLTFSRSEKNEPDCLRVLKAGKNVAIVFSDLAKAIRTGWRPWGQTTVYKVWSGDETDARPTDKTGGIVGLSIKGDVRDDSGFFVHN